MEDANVDVHASLEYSKDKEEEFICKLPTVEVDYHEVTI